MYTRLTQAVTALEHLPPWEHATHSAGDFDLNERDVSGPKLTPAAVLVPIVIRAQSTSVILTKRTDHLHDHPGQVSFPGGRVEPDDTDATATALRETEEETGLARSLIEPIGFLDLYETGSHYLIAPIVGVIGEAFELTPDPFEVAEVFEVPLKHFLNPQNRNIGEVEYKGRMRRYYAYEYEKHHIWGATAGIINNLTRRLFQSR